MSKKKQIIFPKERLLVEASCERLMLAKKRRKITTEMAVADILKFYSH